MPESVPRLLTLLELAELLRVSPHTIRAWIREGRLQPLRLCRRLLFHPTEILRLLGETEATEANEKAADSQSAAKRGMRNADAITQT
jgi:excisionase family DNA binding protein